MVCHVSIRCPHSGALTAQVARQLSWCVQNGLQCNTQTLCRCLLGRCRLRHPRFLVQLHTLLSDGKMGVNELREAFRRVVMVDIATGNSKRLRRIDSPSD